MGILKTEHFENLDELDQGIGRNRLRANYYTRFLKMKNILPIFWMIMLSIFIIPGWSLIRRLFFNTILARENLNQKANFVQGTLKLHNFYIYFIKFFEILTFKSPKMSFFSGTTLYFCPVKSQNCFF